MYDGHVESYKRINLLFDEVTSQYHVMGWLTGAMVNDTFARVLIKAVNMTWYTLANRHVATVWYVLVNTRGLEFLVNCATDTLGARNALITTKRKHKVKGPMPTS